MVEAIESIVLDGVLGRRLASCPYLKRKPLSRDSSKAFPSCWNQCLVTFSHCDFHGVRVKFSGYGIDCLRVIWVCPNIRDVSFLKGEIHGC
jgi:hypothetical protein